MRRIDFNYQGKDYKLEVDDYLFAEIQPGHYRAWEKLTLSEERSVSILIEYVELYELNLSTLAALTTAITAANRKIDLRKSPPSSHFPFWRGDIKLKQREEEETQLYQQQIDDYERQRATHHCRLSWFRYLQLSKFAEEADCVFSLPARGTVQYVMIFTDMELTSAVNLAKFIPPLTYDDTNSMLYPFVYDLSAEDIPNTLTALAERITAYITTMGNGHRTEHLKSTGTALAKEIMTAAPQLTPDMQEADELKQEEALIAELALVLDGADVADAGTDMQQLRSPCSPS